MDKETERESFLKDLKHQTADSHKKLEDNTLSRAILSETVSTLSYQLYLAKLYAMNKACEDQIYPLLTPLINDLQERTKSKLIINDLIATGLSNRRIAELPVHHFQTADVPRALGIMYVLEGSTLGGRILYKHINEKLGYEANHGASYFAGYGAQTGPMWKTFIDILEREAREGKFQQKIIASAIATFKVLERSLS